MSCFHEHPPGAFWATAVVGAVGVPDTRAPLVANALWTLLAVGGVVSLTRRLADDAATALVAGAAFLLHAAMLRSVQRAALEVPYVACAAWSVAGALRLRDGRGWGIVVGAALAGAVLVRGAFAAVPATVVACLLLDVRLRPPPLRLAASVLGAAAAVLVFDRLHAAATGHGFWGAYLERQVVPSFAAEGNRHTQSDPTLGYYLGRAALLSLPWSVVPLAVLGARVRGRTPLRAPAAWRLAALWLALSVAGPCLTSRAASRYLFEAWVPASVLFALALPVGSLQSPARVLAVALPLLVPVLAAGKSLLRERDEPWEAAEILASARASRSDVPRPVRGPFFPGEDGRKSFLRFHLGVPVFADVPAAPRDADLWIPAGGTPPPDATPLVATPVGSLVRPARGK